MKKLLYLLFIYFTFIIPLFAQKVTEFGNAVISFDGKFEVVFPKGFKEPQRSESKDVQKLIMFTSDNERGACILSYNEYDQSVFDSQSDDEILDGAISGYLKDGGNILSKKDITIDGYKGKSVRFQAKNTDGTFFYDRFDCYIIKPRLYQAGFVGYVKNEMDKKDIQDYFSSFTLFGRGYEKSGYSLSSPEGQFEISLPPGFDEPVKNVQSITTDAGNIDMTMYTKESKTGMCLIAFNDYPNTVFDQKSTDQMLDDAMNGAITNQKAILLTKNKLFHEDLPGLSFVVSSKVGTTTVYTRYDYCIKKPRLYQVAYMTYSRTDLDRKENKDYFRSFKITNQ